ncbi:aldo/keto reductase [Entomobacter blattae]|uniref:Aldo-keto reductase IolS n=1 Tax=Entomobacter blattae TaxID=2762277 RepID=A0A7H1NSC2_9PROT|nr:aldo/keto reductase [Entomobacter blattae]QNT78682.1 Aldo-keto reductase IolS [Entomobacter blattae]
MQFRSLGHSGLSVSLAGLGCNNFGGRINEEQSRKVIFKALEKGINFFDLADIYGRRETGFGAAETCVGKILGPERHSVILATKFGKPMNTEGTLKGASRRYIRTAVEASLKRLKTDYIDLYQLHMPDPLTPIEETLDCLNDLIREGKILYAGCSNFAAWEITEAHFLAKKNHWNRLISAQNELSLLNRKAREEILPACHKFGVGFLPFFPLASGLLTGKYKRNAPMPKNSRYTAWTYLIDLYQTEENWNLVERLTDFARQSGRTLTSVALNWLAHIPQVSSIIAGATTFEQVEHNTDVLSHPLTLEESQQLEEILQGHPPHG